MKFSPFDFDCVLQRSRGGWRDTEGFSSVSTDFGRVRVFDSGGDKPVLLMVPDGPCFIEHFSELIRLARPSWRVVVFDMPGFGRSFPERGYRHSFEQASAVIGRVYEELDIATATLAFSCANGFYGLHFSRLNPGRVRRLILIQTPGVDAMEPWKKRAIPWPVRTPYLGQLLVYLKRREIPRVWFKIALPRGSSALADYARASCAEIEAGACNCLASVVQGLSLMQGADLRGVGVPVHLIWGARDHSHKSTDPRSILEIAPNATLEIWDDVGHFANLEQPLRFLQVCGEPLPSAAR